MSPTSNDTPNNGICNPAIKKESNFFKVFTWACSLIVSCALGGVLSFLAVEYLEPDIEIAPYLLHCDTPEVDGALFAKPPGKYSFQITNTSTRRGVLDIRAMVFYEKATLIRGAPHFVSIKIDELRWHYLDKKNKDTDKSGRPYEHGNILMYSLFGERIAAQSATAKKETEGERKETAGERLEKIINNMSENECIRLIVIAEDEWTRRSYSFEKRFAKRKENKGGSSYMGTILDGYEFNCDSAIIGDKSECDHSINKGS